MNKMVEYESSDNDEMNHPPFDYAARASTFEDNASSTGDSNSQRSNANGQATTTSTTTSTNVAEDPLGGKKQRRRRRRRILMSVSCLSGVIVGSALGPVGAVTFGGAAAYGARFLAKKRERIKDEREALIHLSPDIHLSDAAAALD
jgi:hypothetical protein